VANQLGAQDAAKRQQYAAALQRKDTNDLNRQRAKIDRILTKAIAATGATARPPRPAGPHGPGAACTDGRAGQRSGCWPRRGARSPRALGSHRAGPGPAAVPRASGRRAARSCSPHLRRRPGSALHPRLLATLDARRVHATFFLLGPMVQAPPGSPPGSSASHEIAVHGWEHRRTARAWRATDLARACDTIAAASRAPAYRPPCSTQRPGPDRRAPSRVAADPVEFLGTGVGPGGHAGIGAGDLASTLDGGATVLLHDSRPRPPQARRRPWARCPGCWTSAPAAGCGQARSPGIWRTVPGPDDHRCLRDQHRAHEMTTASGVDHRGSAED
jgi:hypothetical protein